MEAGLIFDLRQPHTLSSSKVTCAQRKSPPGEPDGLLLIFSCIKDMATSSKRNFKFIRPIGPYA